MSYVRSLIEILRTTLKSLETEPGFSAADPHAREMRRWLLIAMADLEERMEDEANESATDTLPLPETATSWIRLKSALPQPRDGNVP